VGPKTAFKNTALGYRSSATDPDGDSVAIRFDWGDGDTSDWSDLVESDESVSDTHQWVSADTYEIRAQAKDATGTTSAWSQPLTAAILGGWAKTFGGTGDDRGRAVMPTADGGYVVTGYGDSYGAGSGDAYLIKTDAFGSQEWIKTFGGTEWDACYSVRQTSDGGYVMLGATGSYGAGWDNFWLIKTDETGNQVWAQTFGGTHTWNYGRSVEQTSDGGYILAGVTYPYGLDTGNIWLIKTDVDGNQTWARTFGGPDHEDGYSVQQTSDGGYILVGETGLYSEDSIDILLIKTDASGNQRWAKTFGAWGWDLGYSVQQTTDGGYVVAGHSQSFGGANGGDVCLFKTDADGNQVWAKSFGGANYDRGNSVQQTSDGGYIVVGMTMPDGFSRDVYLVKTDASGTQTWTRTYGGTADDEGYSVLQTADGGYIICGTTASSGAGKDDIWLIRTDANGNVE